MSTLGIGNNVSFEYDGTNNVVKQGAGNITIENNVASGAIRCVLATTTTATEFNVKDSANTDRFRVQADGTITPSPGASTGNWVFNSNDAGLAGDTDLIQLAANSITMNANITTVLAGDTYTDSLKINNNSGTRIMTVRGNKSYGLNKPYGLTDVTKEQLAAMIMSDANGLYDRGAQIRSDPGNFQVFSGAVPVQLGAAVSWVVGDRMFITGGFSATLGGPNVNIYTASIYNPGSWSDTGDDIPKQATTAQIYLGQDGIYIYGHDSDNASGNRNQILYATYDAPTTFTLLGNTLPEGRNLGSVIRGNGRALLFGGSNGGGRIAAIQEINTADPSTFRNIGNMSGAITGIANHTVFMLGDRVYMCGGNNTGGSATGLYYIDIDNPTVTVDSTKTIPVSMDRPRSVVANGKVYLYSDGGSKIYSSSVSDLNTWAAESTPSSALIDSEIAVIGEHVYIVAGLGSDTVLKSVSTYTLSDIDDSIYIGRGMSGSVTTGSSRRNIAIGNYAMRALTTGQDNIAIGQSDGTATQGCLGQLSTGSNNTAIGWRAGEGITTTSNSSCMGREAGLTGNFSNSTCLGYQAVVAGNNEVQLGNSSTTTYVYGTVQDRSDERDKADIADSDLGLEFIKNLRPRKFKWDYRIDYATTIDEKGEGHIGDITEVVRDGSKKRSRFHYGLVAQEMKDVMDTMGVDFGGYQDHTVNGGLDVLTVGYNELIAPLIKAVQEQKVELDAITSRVAALETP